MLAIAGAYMVDRLGRLNIYKLRYTYHAFHIRFPSNEDVNLMLTRLLIYLSHPNTVGGQRQRQCRKAAPPLVIIKHLQRIK